MNKILSKYLLPLSKRLSVLLPSLALGCAAFAAQPYGYCWHPEHLIKWDGNDPDIYFNRSRIPLQKRSSLHSDMKANSNQGHLGQITNATILYPRCSAAPSQGDFTFTGYQPTYWQYMDKLVYWAGSASEGIIIPPPAPSIDAAHLSGVKALGQVFFPPTYYGGKREWVNQMLTRENGSFPYAVKLFEVARDLGFDGWFINEETGGAQNSDWVDFIACFNNTAQEAGYPDMEIQWYNASRLPNTAILSTHPNTSQFLEYGAIGDKRNYAEQINCTPDETFSKIYAGIECAQSGLTGYSYSLNQAFPASGHLCSVALFCPEEHSWKDNVRNILDSQDTGQAAYTAVKKVFQDEEKVWVNANGNPSRPGTSWKGISAYIQERSAITSVPFRSDFCVGVGKAKFANGEKISEADWHHSGIQSVLPTWRWWIEGSPAVKAEIDWENVFALGNSFKLTGIIENNSLLRLYKTEINIEEPLILKVAFKGETPSLALSTLPSLTPDAQISSDQIVNLADGWKEISFPLSSLSGKTIYLIGLNLSSSDNASSFHLGSLAILPADRALQSPQILNPEIDPNLGQEKGELRLTWEYTPNPDFDYFSIIISDAEGNIITSGHTRGEGFYFPEIKRPYSGKINIELAAILKDGSKGNSKSFNAEFPKLDIPEVTFKLSQSYLRIGQTATITAKASNLPTKYTWSIPQGLEQIATPSENSVTVKALAAGKHTVSVNVQNESGSTIHQAEAIDVLSQNEYDDVQNIMVGKKIVDFSSCTNSNEHPAKLIDGNKYPASLSDKWCALDSKNWVIFDCGDTYRLYGFKIYDCKAGPEDAENFHSFTIEISPDGSSWTKILDETGRQADNIKEDWIAPAEGRYIRFSPTVAGVLRVWEFEAYGRIPGSSALSQIDNTPQNKIIGIYTPEGLQIPQMRRGINIVKYADGKTERIIRYY